MTPASARNLALAGSILALCACLPITIAGMNIAAGLVTGALLWAVLAGDAVPWKRALLPANYLLWAYFATAILVSIMAVDPSRCWPDLQRESHKLWVFPLFLVALAAAPGPGIPSALAGAFALIACVGIYQALTQRVGENIPVELMTRMRAHGFVHAVTYGQQMTLAVLGGICFLPAQGGPEGRKRKPLLLAFLVLTMAALLLSQTRSALLSLAAGFAAICVVDKRFRRYGYWALGIGLAGILLLEIVPGRTRSLTGTLLRDGLHGGGDNNLNPQFHRLILWKVAWQMFGDYPFLGIGLGNYKTAFVSYFQGKVDGQWVWHSAHNLYLHQLAERGLLGFSVLLALFGLLTARAFQRARANPSGPNLWALSTMAAFIVMNLTESAFQVQLLTTLVLFIWAWAEASHAG